MEVYKKRSELVELYNELEKKKLKVKKEINEIDGSFGIFHLSKVYSEVMDPINFSEAVEESKFLLHSFEYLDKKYNLVFDFLNKYGIGDSFSVDQFKDKLNGKQYKELLNCVNMFEEILLENSINMFSKLSNTRKIVHRELDRLIPSRKRRNTYYFRGKENKKFAMGFIVIPNF